MLKTPKNPPKTLDREVKDYLQSLRDDLEDLNKSVESQNFRTQTVQVRNGKTMSFRAKGVVRVGGNDITFSTRHSREGIDVVFNGDGEVTIMLIG